MKHVLAENYERLFGRKLLKESVSVRSTGKTDSWNRPIYKDENGNTYVDIDLGQEDEPNLHTVSSQGEPLDPVHDFTLNEIDDLDDHGDVGIGGGNTANTSQSPMGFDEFMEAIQEYDVEGGFGSGIDSGYEIYYAPEDTIGFGKKFSADTPEDAYQKYLQYFKTQTTPMGHGTDMMGESNKIGKSMKHVLAENYERLFGKKLVKEDRGKMKTSKFDFSKNFTASVEIEALEKRGWDFSYSYEEVANAQNLSLEDAENWEKENYYVSVEVNEDGGTYYAMCQKAHYGNECFGQDPTGDDSATIEDLKALHEEGLLWDCEQTA